MSPSQFRRFTVVWPSTFISSFNGIGGTLLLELYIAYHALLRKLDGRSVRTTRHQVSNDMTSLQMQGLSASVLRADADTLRR